MACLQAVVCLLLAALLLYNPFVGLIHSQTGLLVHHLARNRATAGSAELRHFSPVSNGVDADVQLEERTGGITPASSGQEFRLTPALTRNFIINLDFSSNLWFRPPPSA